MVDYMLRTAFSIGVMRKTLEQARMIDIGHRIHFWISIIFVRRCSIGGKDAHPKYRLIHPHIMTGMDTVIDFLESMEGVIHVLDIPGPLLDDLRDEESKVKAVMNIGVRNEGLSEVLDRERVICIIKDSRFRPAPEPTVVLRTDSGQITGMEVFPHQRKEYEGRDDIIWLTSDFVVFTGSSSGTEEAFVMPPVRFPELEEGMGCSDVVSSSPSATSDKMIKERFGLEDDPSLASILVGFNIIKK